MRFLIGSVLLSVLASAVSATKTEHFTVITGGNQVGHLTATHDAGSVMIDYDVKNNGRGPTITERLAIDSDGLPTHWTITGATTFGSRVDERFETDGKKAIWKDAVGEASAIRSEPSIYVGQSGSPWSLGLYARALLADEDRSLPVLPSGSVRLTEEVSLDVSDGQQSIPVQVYAVKGLRYAPEYVVLDKELALFAVINARTILVRKGFEAEQKRLQDLAVSLSTKRLEAIQAKTAHRFDAAVRFRNVRVFDPTRLALSDPVSVVVSGSRISGIQPVDAAASTGEVIIDGEGGTLVAGLHEMHGHFGQEGGLTNLAAGVTSIRDMGNDNAILDALIKRIDAGIVGGPRLYRSGFIEGKSPFNSNNGILVNSEAEALNAVRWYAARDFVQVKLYNSMKPEWSVSAAKEAHRLGLRVAGHVPAFANADNMIDAGYDELSHLNQVMLGWVLAPDEDTRTLLRLTALKRLATLDLQSARVQKTIDHIVERKVAVEPTMAIHENLLLNRGGAIPSGMADYFDHLPVGEQRAARQPYTDMSAPGDAKAYAAAFEKMMKTLRDMRKRGVLLIPGTDLGGALTLHREMQLFERIGYSPAEVIKLSTLDMARYLGVDQRYGSIEKGKDADFFLIPGDPTTDLRALKSVRAVMKGGVMYFPSEIYPEFGIKPFATAPNVTETPAGH